MTPPRRRDGRTAGFTLVEVLVALALAGIISLLMLSGIGLAGQGLDRLVHRADQLEERRSLEILMRRALTAAVTGATATDQPAFIGQPTSLSFLSVIEDGGPGLYRFTLALDATRPKPRLILTRRPAAKMDLPRTDGSVLVPDVRSFVIGYFGAASPAAEPAWHRHWQGITNLPALVRILLDTGDGEAQPAIMVRVRDAL